MSKIIIAGRPSCYPYYFYRDKKGSGLLQQFKVLKSEDYCFLTPSDVVANLVIISALAIMHHALSEVSSRLEKEQLFVGREVDNADHSTCL